MRSILGPQTNENTGGKYAKALGDLLDCRPEVKKNLIILNIIVINTLEGK